VIKDHYVVPSSVLGDVYASCIVPECILQDVEDLQEIIVSEDTCSRSRLAVLSDPKFAGNFFHACMAKVFPTPCATSSTCNIVSIESKCKIDTLSCTIPCDVDDDCYNGFCNDTLYGRSCVDLMSDEDYTNEVFFECIIDSVDPYLSALIVREVIRSDSSTDPVWKKFTKAITMNECVSPGEGRRWPIPLSTQGECVASAGYCPWNYCLIGNSTECTLEACMDAMPSDFYCAYDSQLDYSSITVSRPDLCEIRVLDTNDPRATDTPDICKKFGGTYTGIDTRGTRPFGTCLLSSATTQQQCLNTNLCIPGYKNVDCASYCYNSNAVNIAACAPVSFSGYAQAWYSWTGPGGVQRGRCVIEAPSLKACESDPFGVFQPGFTFLPAIWNSPASCPSLGCWNRDTLIQRDVSVADCPDFECTSCYTGTEPACFSEAECLQTMSCNVPEGCRYPLDINTRAGYDIGCVWTPLGCILPMPKVLYKNLKKYEKYKNIFYYYHTKPT